MLRGRRYRSNSPPRAVETRSHQALLFSIVSPQDAATRTSLNVNPCQEIRLSVRAGRVTGEGHLTTTKSTDLAGHGNLARQQTINERQPGLRGYSDAPDGWEIGYTRR